MRVHLYNICNDKCVRPYFQKIRSYAFVNTYVFAFVAFVFSFVPFVVAFILAFVAFVFAFVLTLPINVTTYVTTNVGTYATYVTTYVNTYEIKCQGKCIRSYFMKYDFIDCNKILLHLILDFFSSYAFPVAFTPTFPT